MRDKHGSKVENCVCLCLCVYVNDFLISCLHVQWHCVQQENEKSSHPLSDQNG